MDDLSGMLSSFLSQPGAMDQLQSMARQLGLGNMPEASSQPETGIPEDFSPEMIARIMSALSEASKGDEVTELLEALRAVLKPERQEKIDRAIRALRLMRAAKTVTGVVEL